MKNFNKCSEFSLLKTLGEKNEIKEQLEIVIKNNTIMLGVENIDKESQSLLQLDTINTKKQLRELEQVIEQIQDRIRQTIAYSDKF